MPVSDLEPVRNASPAANRETSDQTTPEISLSDNISSDDFLNRRDGQSPVSAHRLRSVEKPDIAGYSDRLHRAMAAVDIQLAIEDLDREDGHQPSVRPYDSDEPVGMSLEELLSRELSDDVVEPPQAEAEEEAEEAFDIDASDEQDAIVGLATLHVERACRDVIDEAKSEALMRRIVRQRKEAMSLAVKSEELQATDTGTDTGADTGIELPAETARKSFSSAYSARRLAYAATAMALLGAGAYATGYIADFPPAADLSAGMSEQSLSAASMSSMPTRVIVSRQRSAANIATATRAQQSDTAAAQPLATEQAAMETVVAKPVVMPAEVETEQPQQAGVPPFAAVVQESSQESSAINLVNSYAQDDPTAVQTPKAGSDWNNNLSARLSVVQPVNNVKTAVPQVREVEPDTAVTAPAEGRVAALPANTPERSVEELPAGPENSQQLSPRSELAVERALSEALGLDGIGQEARAELKTRLVSGECLTTALTGVLGQVPILAMRDLVRTLDSEC